MDGSVPLPVTSCMNDKAFLDTDILVYAHESGSGHKHEQARALVEKLWNSGGGVLSTQVLQELCINLRRKTAKPWTMEETQNLIEDYKDWQIVINTPDSIIEAMTIEARYQISFWDALIVQAAGISGVATLYSEDLSDGQVYGTVRVVNPFKQTAT